MNSTFQLEEYLKHLFVAANHKGLEDVYDDRDCFLPCIVDIGSREILLILSAPEPSFINLSANVGASQTVCQYQKTGMRFPVKLTMTDARLAKETIQFAYWIMALGKTHHANALLLLAALEADDDALLTSLCCSLNIVNTYTEDTGALGFILDDNTRIALKRIGNDIYLCIWGPEDNHARFSKYVSNKHFREIQKRIGFIIAQALYERNNVRPKHLISH